MVTGTKNHQKTNLFSWDTQLPCNIDPAAPEERLARIRLFRSPQIGIITYTKLLTTYKSALEAIKHLPQLINSEKISKSITLIPEKDIEKEITSHEKIGARLLVYGDLDYPKSFYGHVNLPPVLSVLGDTSLLHRNSVAIVGARNCSLTGRKLARNYATALGQERFVVVSGLARGIDGEAHIGALKSGTIGVIAGGIDQIYPPEHESLYHQMAKEGLLVSESPFGCEPRADLFPKRNRIIAALSRGVVIIEAALKSGSLLTAGFARELQLPVFVVPGSPLDPRYGGSNSLLRDGAHFATSPEDIIEVLNEPHARALHEAALESYSTTHYQTENNPYFDDEIFADTSEIEEGEFDQDLEDRGAQKPHSIEEEILENLSTSPIFLDELIEACSFSTKQVMAALSGLELEERVIRHPGDRISKVL